MIWLCARECKIWDYETYISSVIGSFTIVIEWVIAWEWRGAFKNGNRPPTRTIRKPSRSINYNSLIPKIAKSDLERRWKPDKTALSSPKQHHVFWVRRTFPKPYRYPSMMLIHFENHLGWCSFSRSTTLLAASWSCEVALTVIRSENCRKSMIRVVLDLFRRI